MYANRIAHTQHVHHHQLSQLMSPFTFNPRSFLFEVKYQLFDSHIELVGFTWPPKMILLHVKERHVKGILPVYPSSKIRYNNKLS